MAITDSRSNLERRDFVRSASSVVSLMLVAGLVIGGFAVAWTSLAAADQEDETSPASPAQKEQAKDDDKKPDSAEKPVTGEDGKPIENPFPNRFPAASLDGGEAWLNTSGEITLKDLRGKVVLIDFWTYCCINCIHVLPDLKFLEKKYPNELVVIGCHSAKFDNEKDTEQIRRAIVRYEIEHPVINDSEMTVWRKYGAQSWPTIVLIDPEGNYCGYINGEGNREVLDSVIEKLIAYHKAKGSLDETPVQFDLERNRIKGGALKFPGKLLADEANNRLFISDSNHNRIVVSTLDGKLIDIIGNGRIGADDGAYREASFDHPQGMALLGETLYVADTENHLLRTVDLKAKTVATLAGTGKQSRIRVRGGDLKTTALNSPWDLEIEGDVLFIAMAGPHQIWSHTLGTDEIGVYAGSGREDIIDGPLVTSALAQPSGIVSDGEFLYVADSEGSSIRKVSVDPKGDVTTIAGAHDLPNGRTLFTFGDRDAIGSEARLQHPLGVALNGDTLFVADAYNHKVRAVDLKTRETTTFLGDGTFGSRLEPVRLHEPAGMTVAAGTLFVADTSNHRILAVDLKTRATTEFKVEGLTAPVLNDAPRVTAPKKNVKAQQVALQTIKVGKSLKLRVSLEPPDDYKVNELAPIRAKLATAADQTLISAENLGKRVKGSLDGTNVSFEFPLASESGKATYQIAVTWSYCRGGTGGLCKIHTTYWNVPIELAADGTDVLTLKTGIPD